MAEIATSVLHNVGNVLNSVQTSTRWPGAAGRARGSDQMGRLAAMLEEHQEDLATFLTQDERGQHVLPFLSNGTAPEEERQEIARLLDGRQPVHRPHRHHHQAAAELRPPSPDAGAGPPGGAGGGCPAHQRDRAGPPWGEGGAALALLPPVLTDKHKVLMILVNLISNAKHALDARPWGSGA